MQTDMIYDIAGIGIGPFNLGLAALCHPIKNLKTIFMEQKPEFSWHEGMLIPGTTLQVSYLADLVTLADPSSIFSYLNFLRRQNRLLQFGIHESSHITRSEYNRYCKWVCSEMRNLFFDTYVDTIFYNDRMDCFEIFCKSAGATHSTVIRARHIVTGIGTTPVVPNMGKDFFGSQMIHSSDYMYHRRRMLASESVAVIGSGQSAAEIVYDLLQADSNQKITWVTKSDRFYAMEHSRLNFELTSPDYIDFFYRLPDEQKQALLAKQQTLYKGINQQLINAIYDTLYNRFTEGHASKLSMHTNSVLDAVSKSDESGIKLLFHHELLNKRYPVSAGFVVLATGYRYCIPGFLKPLKQINYDDKNRFLVNRNYSVDNRNRIFVQNAEMHTHGFNAPDLGLGAYRNAVIINTILQQNIYPVDENTCFQSFGVNAISRRL